MKADKRKDMKHLKDVSNRKLIDAIVDVTERYDGQLFLSIQEKIDGAGIRFGKDGNGVFFMETSRSGIIYDGEEFVKYVLKRKGSTFEQLDRAMHYRDVFYKLELLAEDIKVGTNTKIFAEMLYKPMGKMTGPGEWTFVKTPYTVYDELTVLWYDGGVMGFNPRVSADFRKTHSINFDVLKEIVVPVNGFSAYFVKELKGLLNDKNTTPEQKACYNKTVDNMKRFIGRKALDCMPNIPFEGVVCRIDELTFKVTRNAY